LEIAKTLPVELLRLMGYARGAFSLGYVGDLMDPLEVVHPEIADAAPDQLENTAALLKTRVEREEQNALRKNFDSSQAAELEGDKQ
jgi:hypothetical protein